MFSSGWFGAVPGMADPPWSGYTGFGRQARPVGARTGGARARPQQLIEVNVS